MKRKHFIKEMKWREIKFIILVDVDIFRSQSFPYFALNYRGVTFLNEVVNQNLCLIVALHQHLTVILTRESSQASSLNFTDAGGGGSGEGYGKFHTEGHQYFGADKLEVLVSKVPLLYYRISWQALVHCTDFIWFIEYQNLSL